MQANSVYFEHKSMIKQVQTEQQACMFDWNKLNKHKSIITHAVVQLQWLQHLLLKNSKNVIITAVLAAARVV